MAKQPRVWTGSQWEELAVTLPDLSNYSTTTQMNTAIDNAKGLVLVTSATIGSAVASVEVTNAFSSTYDNYLIQISGGVGSTAGDYFRLQLGSSTSGYYNSGQNWAYINATNQYSQNNGAYWTWMGGAQTTQIAMSVLLINPFLAKHTMVESITVFNDGFGKFGGIHQVATSYSSFKITPNAGTLTGGTIRVYGYRNS